MKKPEGVSWASIFANQLCDGKKFLSTIGKNYTGLSKKGTYTLVLKRILGTE